MYTNILYGVKYKEKKNDFSMHSKFLQHHAKPCIHIFVFVIILYYITDHFPRNTLKVRLYHTFHYMFSPF